MQKFKQLLFLLFLSIMLSSCNKNSYNSHPLDILRVDIGNEVPTLDPAKAEDVSSSRVSYDLFAGLIDFDQANNPIPGMAKKWDISEDKKIYTFHLRQNLRFSDGVAIKAQDFVYSWQRLVDPKVASPYAFLLDNIINANLIIEKNASVELLCVKALDDYTLRVQLNNLDDNFLNKVAMSNAYVVPKHIITKFGKAWTDDKNIVTSGAYKLKEHVLNGYILAIKNPYYYDAKKVTIEKVKYYPYESKNASINNYKSGSIDLTFQAVPVDQYLKLKQDFAKELNTIKLEGIYYYDFNFKNPTIASNKKLRQALSMAVDRHALTQDVLKAGQIPLYSIITNTVANENYADLKYDWAIWPREKQIEEAKKLYKEAGYSKNNPLKLTLTYDTNDLHKKVALAVTSMWRSILGAKITLQNQEWKTFLQTRHNANYELARDGWNADYNGISSYTPLYKCNSGVNNSHYCNSKYDELINIANNTLDATKQLELYKRALQIPQNDYITIPLFQQSYQQMIKPYIKNYRIDKNYLAHMQSKWISFK